MSETLTASLEERTDGATQRRVREVVAASAGDASYALESTASAPRGRIAQFFENSVAKRLGHRHLVKLATHHGRVSSAWREIPDRMHLVANQTKLMFELVDDFRAGTYRKIPWRSLATVAGAILYVGSPADVLPDVLVGLGFVDDIAVVAFAAKMVRKDLEAYCEFKGYSRSEYFR
jgi:uncharacterized membrane protein YkvA (DUF1232 family)